MQATESANQTEAVEQIEVFEYPPGPEEPVLQVWGAWAGAETVGNPEPSGAEARHATGPEAEAGRRAASEERLVNETRRSFEAGRERGRLEGRESESAAKTVDRKAAEESRARQIAEQIENFAEARDGYLQAAEREVVKLALAISARILRREAQMDPLLLTGAVRVALGQLSASTQVRLRVPPNELDMWTETMALLPSLAVKPVVVPGEGMRLGECAIDAEMGTVDLGIRAQLAEIERGFFDRVDGASGGAESLRDEAALAVGDGRR